MVRGLSRSVLAIGVGLASLLLVAEGHAAAPVIPAPTTVGRFAAMSPAARAQLLVEAHQEPFSQRLLTLSEQFLETPYVVSPLGEGEGPDPDPRFRWDAVDCLTLVEQTIALALSAPPGSESLTPSTTSGLDRYVDDALLPVLDRIRYGASVSYAERNHLMEAHWIPSNLAKGFIRDATRRIRGAAVVTTEKVLAARTWTSVSSTELKLPASRQAVGRFALTTVTLETALAKMREIPSGTLLLVVREDLPLKATRITHLGFVVQKKKRAYLRHAAKAPYHRVIDEDLETFLTRNGKYAKWRVTGVSLLEVTEPPQTVASPE